MLKGTLQDWLDDHVTGLRITCKGCGHNLLMPAWFLLSKLGACATYEQIEAAMIQIGIEDRQETGRWLNNRAENSHQPFRRRERGMGKFRSTKSLQKFVSIHASVHNHFNKERHLNNANTFKTSRAAALREWR
jgi:hypothetical protein